MSRLGAVAGRGARIEKDTGGRGSGAMKMKRERVLPPHSPAQLGVSPSRPRRPGCTPFAASGHPCGVTRSIATGGFGVEAPQTRLQAPWLIGAPRAAPPTPTATGRDAVEVPQTRLYAPRWAPARLQRVTSPGGIPVAAPQLQARPGYGRCPEETVMGWRSVRVRGSFVKGSVKDSCRIRRYPGGTVSRGVARNSRTVPLGASK